MVPIRSLDCLVGSRRLKKLQYKCNDLASRILTISGGRANRFVSDVHSAIPAAPQPAAAATSSQSGNGADAGGEDGPLEARLISKVVRDSFP